MPRRDLRTAKRFFEYAQVIADTHNYDYAIECFINGLRHDPDNIGQYEALYAVALKRRAAGGKPPGLGERLKKGAKDPVDRLLHAVRLWCLNPADPRLLLDAMARAAEAEEKGGELHLAELAYWMGSVLLETPGRFAQVGKGTYVKLRDLFGQIGVYDKAVEACKTAIEYDPQDTGLRRELKRLEEKCAAEATGRAGLSREAGDRGKAVAPGPTGLAKESGGGIDSTEGVINRCRAALEGDAGSVEVRVKLAEALIKKQDDAADAEAIRLLMGVWQDTGRYRYRVRVGDVRIRQINRLLRGLRSVIEGGAVGESEAARRRYHLMVAKKHRFELHEFTERVRHAPKDTGLRFELGKRLLTVGACDKAIRAFERAKADVRLAAACQAYLGRCYTKKGWHDEAVQALREGVQALGGAGDRTGHEMRYLLMRALIEAAGKNQSQKQAEEARRIGSHLLQATGGYRDVQVRVMDADKLIDELCPARRVSAEPVAAGVGLPGAGLVRPGV